MLALLLACAWEVPLDPEAASPLNGISGELLFLGDETPGNAFVLAYSAADPGPPAGTGRPVNFATVAAESFTGEGASSQAAPWGLSQVPDGDYLLTTLVDQDGDFNPLASATGGATCGDWIGGHFADLLEAELGPVSVAGGEQLDDVPLVAAAQLSTERPAFAFAANAVSSTSADPADLLFSLMSTGISTEALELTGPFDGTDACDTAFWVLAMDADGDGAPDPHENPLLAAQGFYDIWPKIYVQYTGEGGPPLAEGESWASEAPLYPSFLLTGEVALNTPTPLTELSAIFVPAAQHTLSDGTEELVTAPNLPTGAWAVTVVSFTGQTWTLPNEVAAWQGLEGFDPSTQAGYLLVQ